jgi:PAS domain S-box-containing protein
VDGTRDPLGNGQPPADPADDDAKDLYENAPCGYLSILADGLIVRVNRTFLTWTGYEATAVRGGVRFADLLTIGGRIFYETHFRPLLRMQGFVREIAFDVVCQDGRRLPVLVNAVERDRGPADHHVTRITVFDATDRRRYERELLLARNAAEQAARARSDLIAMISHDVRAPLSAIVTSAALLEKTDPTPQQQRFIRVLRSSAAHAATLVSSVLDLSRLDAGRTVLREREFGLLELVQEIAAAARVAAGVKPELTITATVDPAVPLALLGDRGKIGQVLTNLVTNAVKFTAHGFVSIIVSLRELTGASASLEFVVSDTGIGIPADRLPHIFEEFTQASEDIADTYGGTGLGLAITQKLLLLYGSELSVTSTVGQGSTFSFGLDLKRPPPA